MKGIVAKTSSQNVGDLAAPPPPRGGGGQFLIRGSWGCAAGWGRIFTTGLTDTVDHGILLLQLSTNFDQY